MHRLKKVFCYFLAFIFHFIPRNRHLWLTGKPSAWYKDFAPPEFFDNSKYFYLYLVNETAEKVFWVSSSESEIALLQKYGLPYLRYGTLKTAFYILRAGFFFHHYGIDQINPVLQAGAIQIDFWHGTPLKKIRYDVVSKPAATKNPLARFLGAGENEYVASTSTYLSKEILARAFGVPVSRCLNFGYPRTDVLRLSKNEAFEFCKKYSTELLPYIDAAGGHKRTLLYMPTWRDDDPDYFSKAQVDFNTLNEALKHLDYIFFIKLHPLTKNVPVERFSNIMQINNDVDIYPFLIFTDYLITDYSSIYFDYLLLDREMIFIPYDFEDYTRNRALYFDYDKMTPGMRFKDFDDFAAFLKVGKLETLDYREERLAVKEKLVQDYDFNACQRVYGYFSQGGKQ